MSNIDTQLIYDLQDKIVDLQKTINVFIAESNRIAEIALAHGDIAIADSVVGMFRGVGLDRLADKIVKQIEQAGQKE